MRRRSNVPPVLPIRPSELFNFHDIDASTVSRKSVVPRHLDFDRKPSRASLAGKPHGFRPAADVPPRSRMSLSSRPRNDVPAMDGVSLLGQTINESSDDVTVQIPKAAGSSGLSRLSYAPGVEKKSDNVRSKFLPSNSKAPVPKKTPVNLNKSKEMSKPKVSSAEKTGRDSAELNSTAAFEGEEIAALTSTPHPERKSKGLVPSLSSAAENSELAEQMKLFIMDQRSLMQAVKLSFQKMNSVMDQMNSLMSKLNLEADSHTEFKLVKKSEPLPILNGEISSEDMINSEQISKSCDTILSSLVSNDDKENVGGKVVNPVSMFSDMKSQLKCLKTPTSLRTRPLSAETPNTILSNTLHTQLENLYESNEMDD